MPLSLMTALSLRDLGYSVDPSQAEAYTVPSSSGRRQRRRRLRDATEKPDSANPIPLGNDVLQFPITQIDESIGTTVPKPGREAEYQQQVEKFAKRKASIQK